MRRTRRVAPPGTRPREWTSGRSPPLARPRPQRRWLRVLRRPRVFGFVFAHAVYVRVLVTRAPVLSVVTTFTTALPAGSPFSVTALRFRPRRTSLRLPLTLTTARTAR